MFCENDKYNITFGWIVFLETVLILAFEVNFALNKHYFRLFLKHLAYFQFIFISTVYILQIYYLKNINFKSKKNIVIVNGNSLVIVIGLFF